MAGHSKWATTKHKKAATDAKRGKLFARLVKNIEVAGRTGGPDPAGNPTLFDAIQKAKKNSVPADNIERALKRAAGEGEDGVQYETIMYEGYAAGGVAVLIECLTDNRNRAATEVRTAMTRNNGNLGESGSVAYMFNRVGYVLVKKGDLTEDDVLMAVLEAGAEEVNDLGEHFEVICEPTDTATVRDALEAAEIEVEEWDQDFRADVNVPLELEDAQKVAKLIDALEDADDVQNVYTNLEVSDEVAAALAEA